MDFDNEMPKDLEKAMTVPWWQHRMIMMDHIYLCTVRMYVGIGCQREFFLARIVS